MYKESLIVAGFRSSTCWATLVQNFSRVAFLAAGLFCEQPDSNNEIIAVPHTRRQAVFEITALALRLPVKDNLEEATILDLLKRGMRVAGILK
jgi:hypothetical protein